MSLSIVMPVYNERSVIERVVGEYCEIVGSHFKDFEMILVDDCSTDGTADILGRMAGSYPQLKVLRTETNGGHGRAIRMGYEASSKEWVFQVDSDRQFEASDFWRLYEGRHGKDLVLGVRRMRRDPLSRLFLTRVIRLFNSYLFGIDVRDANCPFRLMKRQVLDRILENIDPKVFAPNIFISLTAKKMGFGVAEVEVAHHERQGGPASLSHWKVARAAWRGFLETLRFRANFFSRRLSSPKKRAVGP